MLLANMAISISIPNDPKIFETDFETILNDLLKSEILLGLLCAHLFKCQGKQITYALVSIQNYVG